MFSFGPLYPILMQQREFSEACRFEVPQPLLLQTGHGIDVGEKLREFNSDSPISNFMRRKSFWSFIWNSQILVSELLLHSPSQKKGVSSAHVGTSLFFFSFFPVV